MRPASDTCSAEERHELTGAAASRIGPGSHGLRSHSFWRQAVSGEPGSTFAFEEVLLASADGGIQVGKPLVSGMRVIGEILRHERAKKILVFKKKRRKNYRRKQGHRQHLTVVRVTGFERGTGA